MAYVAVDKNGDAYIYSEKPKRNRERPYWECICKRGYDDVETAIELPKDAILKLIGRELTWDDEAVEI